MQQTPTTTNAAATNPGAASQQPSEQQRATLMKLSDSGLVLADPAADVRGRKVLDQNGDEIGEVDDLFIDDDEAKVRFLRIKSGGFLGLGATTFLVPVDAVVRANDAVHINQSRERVAGAPRYDPQLANEPDYYGSVYSHYGVAPYWGAGYMYPTYPYFV